jgi:hypothetical protein
MRSLDGWITPPIPFESEGPLQDRLLDPDGVSFPSDGAPLILSICTVCHSSLKNNKLPPLSLANKLFLGSVPEEFRNLTVIDETMIARCRSKCWIIQRGKPTSNSCNHSTRH